jgi:hypothetical protein
MMAASARQRFLEDYRTVRSAEGRGSRESGYYCALPYRDLSGRNSAQWMIRGKSYRYFERKVLSEIERNVGRQLDVLDLGAGNCWMSYRLSLRKHKPVALDIFTDALDGLTAARHYDVRFPLLDAALPSPRRAFCNHRLANLSASRTRREDARRAPRRI